MTKPFAITVDGKPYPGISRTRHQDAKFVTTVAIEGTHEVFYMQSESSIDSLKSYLTDNEQHHYLTGLWACKQPPSYAATDLTAKLWDEKNAFNQSTEIYIGTWYGFDIWEYVSTVEGRCLLAVEGNEPGDYATWIWDGRHFEPQAKIGTPEGPKPMADHMTETNRNKAFLLAMAAIYTRSNR